MATDQSEPKIGNIVKVAVTSIVILITIRIGLVTYFHHVTDTERQIKYVQMGKPQELKDLRSDEAKRLGGIDQSMQMLAAKGRMEPGIEPQQPKPENVKDTLTGWTQMPRQGGEPAADGGASQPTISADAGGAATTLDGGATATSLDAGAGAHVDGAAPAPPASGAHALPLPSASGAPNVRP